MPDSLHVNILLIDDDKEDRDLFQQALEAVSPGSVLQRFDTCREAVEEFKKENALLPGIIFMDLSMPRLDGYDCLALIKQIPALKDVPIVVLSSRVRLSDMDRLYEAGVAFYIQASRFWQTKTDHQQNGQYSFYIWDPFERNFFRKQGRVERRDFIHSLWYISLYCALKSPEWNAYSWLMMMKMIPVY